jgi:hypothetical protein
MKIAYLILISVILFSCSEKKNDLTKENLKGKVKSITQSTFYSDGKFGELQKGSLISWETYEYADNGNQIEENWYRSDSSLRYKFTFKHDKNGNITEKNSYDSDGSLFARETYKYIKYDKEGNWTLRIRDNSSIEEREIEYYGNSQ